jgi:AraC-like DNA-binding protein
MASSTTSFIKKATFPTMAGNPPAGGAQPSGINGMIVTVLINVTTDPSALQVETGYPAGVTGCRVRDLSEDAARIALMEARLEGDLRLDELASEAGLSTSHFIRGFRQSTGKTPYQFFANQHHMARIFRSVTGLTPSAYRRLL